MLSRTGRPPCAGMCKIMIVSERWPLIALSLPVASCSSCLLVRPWRLSEPVISQLVPAEATGRPG